MKKIVLPKKFLEAFCRLAIIYATVFAE